MPYRLSRLAERDLDEIWSYVAEDASLETADRLIDAIVDRFELLSEQPRMGRLRPEFGSGVRSFTVENHVIDSEVPILVFRSLGRRLRVHRPSDGKHKGEHQGEARRTHGTPRRTARATGRDGERITST
jgi:toxin ParE1/3/4